MTIYQPSEELRPFVRYYRVLESNEPFSVLTFPIGCPQIIFHKKSPLYIPELAKSQSQFTICGQVNFPAHIQSDGRLDMIVVVFYPHTIGMFIDTPPSAFYNMEISGYDIENRQLNEITRIFSETVGMNPKEYSWVVRFQKALWLMQNGEQNYAGIASACGFSDQSHFIRDFKAMSGHIPRSLSEYCLPYSDLFTNPA